MKAKKVLFITQELTPYVRETPQSVLSRQLPQAIQESGREIRTFMPKWGSINERRNQLHEVIRLSGMNIIINDTDHPLIIKVASIQPARMQVYFIDNEDYFRRRRAAAVAEEVYTDSAERAVFFARGVLETLKKLRWCPDVVHCHGWMSAIAPLYIKTAYREEPAFAESKVVFSAYGTPPVASPAPDFADCLAFREASHELIASTGIDLSGIDALGELAVQYSDGFIQGQADAAPNLLSLAQQRGIPTLAFPGEENLAEAYGAFYESVCE